MKILQLKGPQQVEITFENLEVTHPEQEHKSRTLSITVTYFSNTSYSVGEFRNYLLKNLHLHQEILTERCYNWWRTRVDPEWIGVTITGRYKTDPPSVIITSKHSNFTVREEEGEEREEVEND